MSIVFRWPSGPEEVIVTGTFDGWSKQLALIKQTDGKFELEVPLPNTEDKIEFKFIVDGEWTVSEDYWTVVDESGNVNNYVEVSGGTVKSKDIDNRGVVGKTIIPESGLSVKSEDDKVKDKVEDKDAKVPVAGVEPETTEEKLAVAASDEKDVKDEREENGEEEKTGAVGNVGAKDDDAPREKERKYVKRVVKNKDVDDKQTNRVTRSSEGSVNNNDNKKDKKKSFISRLLKK